MKKKIVPKGGFFDKILTFISRSLHSKNVFILDYHAVLAKQQRLSGKEVRFLTKKKQIFSRGIFTLFYVDQYPNRKYNQRSIHTPLAISKRAVHRHKIKRILISLLEKSQPVAPQKYYKGFITINKHKLNTLITYLQEKNINTLITYLTQERNQFFSSFYTSNANSPHNKKS